LPNVGIGPLGTENIKVADMAIALAQVPRVQRFWQKAQSKFPNHQSLLMVI
jgi:hypothetical protein